jgi:hypothetical protein
MDLEETEARNDFAGEGQRGMLLLEAGSSARGPFGNPEEGERSPLEAATEQRQ